MVLADALVQVHVGDVVTVVKGAAADRSGTVKYIFRQFLFLHARPVGAFTLSCAGSVYTTVSLVHGEHVQLCCAKGPPTTCMNACH